MITVNWKHSNHSAGREKSSSSKRRSTGDVSRKIVGFVQSLLPPSLCSGQHHSSSFLFRSKTKFSVIILFLNEIKMMMNDAGRCTETEGEEIAQNPRFFGCSADVTAILHARCSGKKQCEIRIPDPELENTGACVVGLRMFLEASYYCVEGRPSLGLIDTASKP